MENLGNCAWRIDAVAAGSPTRSATVPIGETVRLELESHVELGGGASIPARGEVKRGGRNAVLGPTRIELDGTRRSNQSDV